MDLFRSIPLAGETPYDKVVGVLGFLEKNYRYTVNVQDAGVSSPLRFFFLERKRGHCEYFSTALIVALRFLGVPARQVVGFRGGEYNPIGNYLAVRQNQAHSWAEVYFPKYGWLRFDPSPPDSVDAAARSEFVKSFFQMTDYLRLRWNKYIVEYDLRAQASAIESIGKMLSTRFSKYDRAVASVEKDEVDERQGGARDRRFPWSLTLLFALPVAYVLWLARRRPSRIVSHFYYARVLRRLARRGFKKSATETPLEFTARIEHEAGACPALVEISKMYYAERFGAQSFSIQTWRARMDEFKSSEPTLKKVRRGPSPPPRTDRSA